MKFEIDQKVAKSLARMGPRAAYGSLMYQFIKDGADFLTMSADLGRSSGLERVRKEFPSRFLNVGIAEQSMVAVAAGLAREGATIFASSFAPFISMRASEHVRVNLSYMKEPVKLIGLGSGFSLGFLGNTHYGLEDCSVMNALPNMTILCPADAASVGKAVLAAAEIEGPAYVRLTGEAGGSHVYAYDYDFVIGKVNKVREHGEDVAIVSNGAVLSECVQASEQLLELGVGSDVFDCHTLKPLDRDGLSDLFLRYPLVLSVEEHFLAGGLFSVLAQLKASFDLPGCLRGLGADDEWVSPGERQFVLHQTGLDAAGIVQKVLTLLGKEEVNNDQ